MYYISCWTISQTLWASTRPEVFATLHNSGSLHDAIHLIQPNSLSPIYTSHWLHDVQALPCLDLRLRQGAPSTATQNRRPTSILLAMKLPHPQGLPGQVLQ